MFEINFYHRNQHNSLRTVDSYPPIGKCGLDSYFDSYLPATLKQVKKEPEVTIDESRSNLPVQGPSNIMKVSSKKGKILVVKREGDVEVETEVEPEKPDLRDFKLRSIQNLDLASKRKYHMVGITMEAKYDDMTESEEEREVLRLSKGDQATHKEMKDLMTV